MTYVTFFILPAVLILSLLSALPGRLRWLPNPRSEAEKRAMLLLLSWLTPEQEKQWAARAEFEVIGSDTGTRYRITSRSIMNILQLDPAGRPTKRWCFAPVGGLAPGDVLLAQKIALETMEREALALANSQAYRG
jgi:hypothetical protein